MEPSQTIQSKNSGPEIVWEGKLTAPHVNQWLEISNHWHFDKGTVIILNLENIQRIDSAGIQLLMYIKKACLQQHLTLHLRNHSLPVLKILDVLGLVSYFGDKIKVKKEYAKELEFGYGTKKVN
ncbi:STAS domain-containing protein [Leptospira sp. 96542]|nr:STAS domain-containing protein [Leptospira sp. 96542]